MTARRLAAILAVILHRPGCKSISNETHAPGAHTGRGYRKICASAEAELQLAAKSDGRSDGTFEHDRAAAREAFEAAIVLSPSSAFAYILGSIQLGFAGDVERAIEWGERGLRLSPLDPWSFVACHGMFLGHFQTGRFEEATNAARKSVQHNPGFSISHMFLAAALGKLGRIDEAKAAASRVLALQPGFSIAEWCAATDPVPAVAVPLSDALRTAGLPE